MKRKYFSNNTQKLDLIYHFFFSSFKMNTSFVISWCTLMVSLTWNKWSNHHWEKRTSSAHRILKSGVSFVNNLFASFSHSLWPWLLKIDGISWMNFFLLICFYKSSMFFAFSIDFKVLVFRNTSDIFYQDWFLAYDLTLNRYNLETVARSP